MRGGEQEDGPSKLEADGRVLGKGYDRLQQ